MEKRWQYVQFMLNISNYSAYRQMAIIEFYAHFSNMLSK